MNVTCKCIDNEGRVGRCMQKALSDEEVLRPICVVRSLLWKEAARSIQVDCPRARASGNLLVPRQASSRFASVQSGAETRCKKQ